MLLVHLRLDSSNVGFSGIVHAFILSLLFPVSDQASSSASNSTSNSISSTLDVILNLSSSLLSLAFLVLTAALVDHVVTTYEVTNGFLYGTHSLLSATFATVFIGERDAGG
jgi:hypothetical protein